MSDLLIASYDEGSAPLTAQERALLIPSYISQRRELNEAEQIGIENADLWAFSRRRDVLDVRLLRELHRRMFGAVWSWAGEYSRKQQRRIGLDGWQILPALQQLVGDGGFWIEHRTFPPDEIAVRFHHRLTQIHPFVKGNGRHSRLATDLLAVQLGRERFSWGRGGPVEIADLRRRYMATLHAADGHDIGPLLEFART